MLIKSKKCATFYLPYKLNVTFESGLNVQNVFMYCRRAQWIVTWPWVVVAVLWSGRCTYLHECVQTRAVWAGLSSGPCWGAPCTRRAASSSGPNPGNLHTHTRIRINRIKSGWLHIRYSKAMSDNPPLNKNRGQDQTSVGGDGQQLWGVVLK